MVKGHVDFEWLKIATVRREIYLARLVGSSANVSLDDFLPNKKVEKKSTFNEWWYRTESELKKAVTDGESK